MTQDPVLEHAGRKFYVVNLLRCAVRNAMRLHPGRACWYGVSEVFGIGSTSAKTMCEMLGFDPDTGEPDYSA